MTQIINDARMRQLLRDAQVIAVVGHSNKPERTSYQIAQYLRNVGYKVYAVNPLVTEINGEPCYPSLAEVPETIDIVNVFRRAEYLYEVTEDAIAVGAKSIWGQLGVADDAAAQLAADAGLDVVMDLCIKVEHMRLGIPFKNHLI